MTKGIIYTTITDPSIFCLTFRSMSTWPLSLLDLSKLPLWSMETHGSNRSTLRFHQNWTWWHTSVSTLDWARGTQFYWPTDPELCKHLWKHVRKSTCWKGTTCRPAKKVHQCFGSTCQCTAPTVTFKYWKLKVNEIQGQLIWKLYFHFKTCFSMIQSYLLLFIHQNWWILILICLPIRV